MIACIESGIPGFDELTHTDSFMGGIPENTSTLVYVPPKTGKSVFSNQFCYNGLLNQEPCLYIAANQGLDALTLDMNDFKLPIQGYLMDNSLHVIDTMSEILEKKIEPSDTVVTSEINNPTDLMVKIGSKVNTIRNQSVRFRSVLNSATTLLAYNESMLIVRVIKAYLMRVNEAGGTTLITYTEDSADKIVETMLKSMVDNIIRLDGNELQIEAMKGLGKMKNPYSLTENGIILEK
jgi:KaiC/GvpD/RAD55 family RecA-like ATPase